MVGGAGVNRAFLSCFLRCLKRKKPAARPRVIAIGIPTPSPIFAPVVRPPEDVGNEVIDETVPSGAVGDALGMSVDEETLIDIVADDGDADEDGAGATALGGMLK